MPNKRFESDLGDAARRRLNSTLRGRVKGLIATTQQARAALDAALANFCDDFNNARITPILEADIAGYLYYRLVVNGCPTSMVYLATRVCGEAARSRKLDIVIGSLSRDIACVTPLLISELKVFQRWGHSPQQMNQRFSGHLGDNLPSLEQAAAVLPRGRLAIVADLFVSRQLRGYLAGTWDGRRRKDVISAKCKEIGATFIWLHPKQESDDLICEEVS
ncbi:MAG: hypothetical protein OEZ09_06405 [Betaproteobacteria bacterium]|nr:hypothetical protein [Gammaproteobacteria bacterium]MDH5578073.1 hypothetical protein [Betaproteobacteria bacterium]